METNKRKGVVMTKKDTVTKQLKKDKDVIMDKLKKNVERINDRLGLE